MIKFIPYFLRKMPLRLVLVVPFILQVFGAVGLVGYLSFLQGQEAVNDLASQLMTENSQRVNQHLASYLATPNKLIETNLYILDQKLINYQDFSKLSKLFWRNVKSFNVGYINYGLQTGEYAGAGVITNESDALILQTEKSANTAMVCMNYEVDDGGNRIKAMPYPNYDHRVEAWYIDALQAGKTIWSKVYIWDGGPDIMSIAMSRPIYNAQKQPIGAIGIDFLLSNISHFLQQLKQNKPGQIVLIERDGMIIGSSSTEKPFVEINGKQQRLNILNSQNALTQAAAKSVLTQFGRFDRITQTQQFNFTFQGETQFLQVVPWKDEFGLDWLVILVMPESAFMEKIHANARTTILLCIATLFVTIIVGILTSRWVVKPIRQLQKASHSLAIASHEGFTNSPVDTTVNIQGIHELASLGSAFNQMAMQLKSSFVELEIRVDERTKALQENNQYLSETLRELKKTQMQLIQTEKMSSLGQMIAGIAHEINNPISFIHGNISHAKDHIENLLELLETYQESYPCPLQSIQEKAEEIDIEFVSEDLMQILQSMQTGTNRIKSIVLSLRNFSRLDETELKAVNLHEGIDNTLLIIQHRLEATINRPAIEITKEYSKLPEVECYAGSINQVLLHLLTNAIDALEESNAQKTFQQVKNNLNSILIRTEIEEEKYVTITISDNGNGISEDVKSHIFDPFYTTKPIGKGTGLGLSISYQIITEKHHGKLWCDSTPGEGSKFCVAIPVRQMEAVHNTMI